MTASRHQAQATARDLDAAVRAVARELSARPEDLTVEILAMEPGRVEVRATLKPGARALEGLLREVGGLEAPAEEAPLERAAPREMRIVVSPDRMQARLLIEPVPGFGAEVTPHDVVRLLKRFGVLHGVDAQAVSRAVAQAASGLRVDEVVARGTPPVPGRDGRLELQFRGAPVEITPEDADVRLARTHVRKGSILARLYPPTRGQPGRDVHGEPVPAPDGRGVEIRAGPGVETAEDGHLFLAAVSGHPVLREGVLEVMSLLTVEGDVDAVRSPLHAPGHLLVRGAVGEGVRIHAGGDVYVIRHVVRAEIEAGGNIVVGGGVSGSGREVLSAAGSIRARYAQGAVLKARKDIVIRNSLQQCRCETMGVLKVTEGRARLVAGHYRAAGGVEAGELGSPYGRETVVEVGVGRADRRRLSELKRLEESLAASIEKIRRTVGPLLRDREALRALPAVKRDMIRRVLEKADALRRRRRRVLEDVKRLEELLAGDGPATVVARGKVRAGVEIRMGDAVRKIDSELGPSVFRLEGGRIERRALRSD